MIDDLDQLGIDDEEQLRPRIARPGPEQTPLSLRGIGVNPSGSSETPPALKTEADKNRETQQRANAGAGMRGLPTATADEAETTRIARPGSDQAPLSLRGISAGAKPAEEPPPGLPPGTASAMPNLPPREPSWPRLTDPGTAPVGMPGNPYPTAPEGSALPMSTRTVPGTVGVTRPTIAETPGLPTPTMASPLEQRTAKDRETQQRLDKGSGITQIGRAHPVAGAVLRGLNIAGTVAAPFIPGGPLLMQNLPGTEEHHNALVRQNTGAIGQDEARAEKEAQTREVGARTGLTEAQTAAIPVHSEWERAETYRALHPTEQRDPVEQRRSFAEEHPDMFQDAHEKNNFVLYGQEPKVATTHPNEWQLRLDAASGDEDAQAVLDRRLGEEKTLAGIRGRASADNRASREDDAADAEQIASTILNAAGGDPDKALKLFDQHSGKISDPDQRRLGPAIRRAIRARRQINKPQSALDKIIGGDVEGGLTDMQSAPQ